MTKGTLFTFPGKIGDFFHQWPIAYHWAQKRGKVNVGLDQRMLGPLKPLVELQPDVEKVWLLPGIEHYTLGGQPFDFGFPPSAYKAWNKVYHLGFRNPAEKPITLTVREYVDFYIDTKKLREIRTLVGSRPPSKVNRLILHGQRQPMYGEVPMFWKALVESWDFLENEFDEIVFVGTPADRRIVSRWPGATEFADDGDWVKLVDFVQDARLVIGGGSSMVSLAGALKVPAVRIHDPMPGWDYRVFSNFGPNQWNLDSDSNYRKEIEFACRKVSANFVTN